MQTINIGGVLYLWPGGATLYKAGEPKPCGRGWTGTKPPGCKRAQRKTKTSKKSSKAEAPTKTEKPARSKAKQEPKAKASKTSTSPMPQPKQDSGYKIPTTGRSAVNAVDFEGMEFGFGSLNDLAGVNTRAIYPRRGDLNLADLNSLDSVNAAIERVEQQQSGDNPLYAQDYRKGRNGESQEFLVFSGQDDDVAAKLKKLGAVEVEGRLYLVRGDGKTRPMNAAEKKLVGSMKERWDLHRSAFRDVEGIATEVDLASLFGGRKKSVLKEVGEPLKRHKAATKKLWATEDKQLGRSPSKQNRAALEKTLKAEAQNWAKSMGFTGEGVNGFSADATKAHDIAHPAAHRLLGLDSQQINQTFGGLKDPDGKPSLIAEEALVNAVEHLSRGDTLEASIQNGLRLAKVQSRNGTDEERAYVRSEEFARGVIDLIENRVYKNNEYSNLMPIVRDYNVISGTVTTSGADFTNSASGG